jgi:hypothetical protein
MFRTADQMRVSDFVCDVSTYLTPNVKPAWDLECQTRRELMTDGVMRTRINVTMTATDNSMRTFENLTTMYQDLSNPQVLISRVQQVTNGTIKSTRRCQHSTRNSVMLSNLQVQQFSLIKIRTIQRTLCSKRDRLNDRLTFYALPINVTKAPSPATSKTQLIKRQLTVPLHALYSFGSAISGTDSLEQPLSPDRPIRSVRKEQLFSFIYDPTRYKIQINRQKRRDKTLRRTIRRLNRMFREFGKGTCQRVDVLNKLNGRCIKNRCRLKLRIRYTVADC